MEESQNRTKKAQEKLLERQIMSATALSLRERGFTNRVIAFKMDISESSVRRLLNAQWAEGRPK